MLGVEIILMCSVALVRLFFSLDQTVIILLFFWQWLIFQHMFLEGFNLRRWQAVCMALLYGMGHGSLVQLVFLSLFNCLYLNRR